MKHFGVLCIILFFQQFCFSQNKVAEDYYVEAFNEIAGMLSGRDTLLIKRAVFISEWAYYEGRLDYKIDFCNEIERIKNFVNLFYSVNKLNQYRTGKQMALNEYFFRPYSGNNYLPYTYDFENFSIENENWETQFVSKVLKSHKGQCRSLPWLYKILATELHCDAYLTQAPRHTYIMYKDEDNQTPEDWINLELTTHQMSPSFWIKQNFEICDSAIIVGTYMKPLTDMETVACQLADLAFGYHKKFKRYDEFTYYCTTKSLEYYPNNPTAVLILGKSLDTMLQKHLYINGNRVDQYAISLSNSIRQTQYLLDGLYMTFETPEMRERLRKQTIDAQKYTFEKLLPK